MWKQLHEHFTQPELVELGSFVGYIAGGQRWVKTLAIVNGEFMAETTVGLSPELAKQVQGRLDETAAANPTGADS